MTRLDRQAKGRRHVTRGAGPPGAAGSPAAYRSVAAVKGGPRREVISSLLPRLLLLMLEPWVPPAGRAQTARCRRRRRRLLSSSVAPWVVRSAPLRRGPPTAVTRSAHALFARRCVPHSRAPRKFFLTFYIAKHAPSLLSSHPTCIQDLSTFRYKRFNYSSRCVKLVFPNSRRPFRRFRFAT